MTTEKPAPTTKKRPATSASGTEFEYCDVCRLSHDQGRRHRYYPSHRRALAAALSRFREKLSDLRFFLRHPSPLRPEHASRCRLWCPFCSLDLLELHSQFACSNAIYHLASAEHLSSVKDFLQKHGGGMDQIDSFRISEAELAKWEKGCDSLKTAAETSIEGLIGPSPGPQKDIHTESTSNNLNDYVETYNQCFNFNASCNVMPLQRPTNGVYHPTGTVFSGTSTSGSVPYVTPYTQVYAGVLDAHTLRVAGVEQKSGQSATLGKGFKASVPWTARDAIDQRGDPQGNSNGGLKANVHTGAPPPWLEASESETSLLNKVSHFSSYALSFSQKGRSRKLNPKRVGAAWAERRRAEMEMEKQGEFVANVPDASWLPNFGSVWQSGTRKESRKAFEKENLRHHEDTHYQLSSQIKPYVSKRMRVGSDKDEQLNGFVEEQASIKRDRTE